MLPKHPQRVKFAAPIPENLHSFFVTDFDLYKTIMSFPNGSAAGPDKIVPQIFKDLVSKSNGSAGLNFLKPLTKLINLIGDDKIPEPLRPFFFGAKLIALKKIDEGLRPIAIGNTLRRIASKCACKIRLLRSHMRLKKNRPYNHWLKSQGHYLLCFSTSKRSQPIRFTCDMRLRPVTA